MKKRIISIITALALCLSLCPTWAFAAEGELETPACICEELCTEDSVNESCPVCGMDGADSADCNGKQPAPDQENGLSVISYDESVYSENDVEVINAIIDNNNLSATKDDPASWKFATWDNSSPKRITRLSLDNASLQGTLDVSGLSSLTSLTCSANQLGTLDVSKNTALTWLSCSNNQLGTLDVSGLASLATLFLEDNPLTSFTSKEGKSLTITPSVNGTVKMTSVDLTDGTKIDLTVTLDPGYIVTGLPEGTDTSANPVTFFLNNDVTAKVKKRLTAEVVSSTSKVYDGTNSFTGVALTLTGVISGDTVTATADGTSAGTDVGTYAFTATAITLDGADADYYSLATGDVSGSVEITKKPLNNDMIAAIPAQTYTGNAIQPALTVTDGSPTIIQESDYTVSYTNNNNVGTATVTITATANGNYSGSASKTFEIVKAGSVVGESTISPVTYDQDFTVTFTPKLLTQKSFFARTFSRSTTPAKTAELYFGDTLLATQNNVTENTEVTFTVNADKKIPSSAFDGTAQTFTIRWGGDDNLNASEGSVTATLNKKTLTGEVVSPTSKVYDGTNSFTDVALNLIGVVSGDTVTATATGTAAGTGVGTHAFTATQTTLGGADAGYYSLAASDVSGSVEITPKPLADTMIAAIPAQTYTGSALTPAPTVTLDGKTLTAGTDYTVAYADNTNAGTATITVTGKGNYSGTAQGTFTIDRATPTITWGSTTQELTYTGDPAVVTAPAVTLVGSDTFSGTITYSHAAQGSTEYKDGLPTNAGTYTIKAHADAAGNYSAADSGEMTLTINPSPVTLTFNNQIITYGGTPTGATANPASADIKYSYITGEGGEPISGWPTNAGTYTVTAKVEATGNYGEATATAQLTINKAPLTITGATAASKPYDGTDTAAVTGVTFTGLVNGETLALGTDYTATGTFADANAGENKSVTVTVTLADTAKANNYQLSDSTCTATGTITKADPVVTAVSVSTPATIYESTSLGDITLTHGAGDTAGTVALNPSQTLTVGTKGYAWTFTPDDTDNYKTATGTISLTVAVDALQSIAVTTPPSKTAYTYGESFDKAGMVITATYASGATKVVTGEVQISPAELTVTTTALTITYQGKTVTQAITVSPKTVSAPTIELSPSSFIYDGTEKKPAVTVKDGEKMIPTDEYTVEYSNNTNVGTTATVTITDKDGGNYTVSGTKTFTITAKPLTGARVEVTGTFTYTGSAQEPAPTVTLDGKTLTAGTDYTVAYTDNTNAGTAKITVTGTGNYSGTVQGAFTIGRADLTVDGTGTASGTYGAKLSELTVSGLTAKLGEATVTGTWKLAGGTVPNVGDSGEYTATFTPATGADNYNALTAQVKLNIAQATAPAPQTGTLNVQNGHAREYTYDLSRLLPVLASGQSFGGEVTYTLKTVNITEAGYYDSDTAVISGTTLTLPVKAVTSSDEGQIGTITVTISSKNFADVDATINVKRVNKQPVSIEGVTAQNGTYNGESHNGYTGTPTASPYSGGFTVTYASQCRFVCEQKVEEAVGIPD